MAKRPAAAKAAKQKQEFQAVIIHVFIHHLKA
jgi:hypothetical protein